MSSKNFYVTTPIYYVNDKPHIGHAYTTILADVLAQYHRLMGEPTFFLTGTDEHGLKVQQAAEKAGVSPQAHADRMVIRFQALWKRLEITNDDYIRTTEERHKKIVQEILQDLYDRDEIYKADYDGWYCVSDERFFTEKDLNEGRCPVCGKLVEHITETNYFFRMGKYQEWLIQYIRDHPAFIQPDFRRNETLGFLKQPLQDLCISRPKKRVAWGIDLPFDADFVTYVWFDALVNYISAIGYRRDEKNFKRWWPASFHLIGKDILTTHTVYWPTILKAMSLPLPETIFAHGWWLYGGSKMAKSEGNVVNPMDMIDRYGVDATRYFLIAEMSLGQDANFSEEAFVRRYNSDLANDLGNLLSRILNMMQRYCDGRIPQPSADVLKHRPEAALWKKVQSAAEDMLEGVRLMRLDRAVAGVLAAIRAINGYLETRKPWNLSREADTQPLRDVLYTAAECLRVCAALLHPVMPERMGALRQALGIRGGKPELKKLHTWGVLKPGREITAGPGLFPRIEREAPAPSGDEVAAKNKAKKAKPASAEATEPGLISIQDFARVQLRTAVITHAEKIEGTTKLLRLEVRMGAEKRQLVAGIALHYEPEKLIGHTVIIVANLQPATIKGIESQGMLLCASKGETLRLLAVDGEITSGAGIR